MEYAGMIMNAELEQIWEEVMWPILNVSFHQSLDRTKEDLKES
jgi:hypothetical protein